MYDNSEVIKLLNGTTRSLLRQFEELERPFLRNQAEMEEKDIERFEETSLVDYAPMTLGRRWGTYTTRLLAFLRSFPSLCSSHHNFQGQQSNLIMA